MAKETSLAALLEALTSARVRVRYLDAVRPPGWSRLLGKAVEKVEDLSVDLQVHLGKGSAPVTILQYTGPGQAEYLLASPEDAEALLLTGKFKVLRGAEAEPKDEE